MSRAPSRRGRAPHAHPARSAPRRPGRLPSRPCRRSSRRPGPRADGEQGARRGLPRRQGSDRARPGGRPRKPFRSRAAPERLQDDGIDLFDPLNAVLEVLLPGPAREGILELARVAKVAESVAELRGELVVDGEPLLARGRAEDLVVERIDAAELLDRTLMILDAELDDHVRHARVAAVPLHDEEGGGLLPAAIAAGCLRGGQAVDQPLGEGPATRLEGLGESLDGLCRDEDVALDRVAFARAPTGPVEALLAGVRRGATLGVDDPQLPVIAPVVGARQTLDDLLRGASLPEEVEPLRPVAGVRVGLRGHGPDV